MTYGESDVIVTLFTRTHGKLGAMVRGGRRSARRVGGALEPFHTLGVTIEERGGDLALLREARLVTLRLRLVSDLDALEAGGIALRWARALLPVRTPEPEGWEVILALLDALDAGVGAPRALLAAAGLQLLGAVGYGVDFERCVRCGKACPTGRVAYLSAASGGLVCRACGGASRTVEGPLRTLAQELVRGGLDRARDLRPPDAERLLAIVEEALGAHADVDAKA